MKKDISYKSLIIGSAVYILCGLVIEYLIGVLNVLADQEAAIDNIDSHFTDAWNYAFILFIFITFGVFTFIFSLVFLLFNKKSKFWSLRTFAVSFIAIFVNSYVSYAVAVDDDFIPYFNDFPSLEFGLTPALECTFINYIAFLIAMAIAYRYVSIKKEQEPK